MFLNRYFCLIVPDTQTAINISIINIKLEPMLITTLIFLKKWPFWKFVNVALGENFLFFISWKMKAIQKVRNIVNFIITSWFDWFSYCCLYQMFSLLFQKMAISFTDVLLKEFFKYRSFWKILESKPFKILHLGKGKFFSDLTCYHIILKYFPS